MTAESTERAIRAGFSGNNPFDTLGLFGMGFNIATGKLGRRTELQTFRAEQTSGTRVAIDLERIRANQHFQVPYDEIDKPKGFNSGTQLRVDGWWPDGDANYGFVEKLIQYGLPSIRREIGRRYASILRRRGVRILVNDEECSPFEHCAWSGDRFVERRGHGRIPARLEFDEVVGSQRRCSACLALAEPSATLCAVCSSESFRTIHERIRGWLGIQRFDHATDFGIDLIRNGRAIRIAEKSAFFEWVDELKRVTRDYPIDQQYGRIVGEVHLDHVPVDFLKQDFQRSSAEWSRAIVFLRGSSSLQPNAPGADSNISPLYRLYQGYRRVRIPGRTDLYMGYWDVNEGKPKRVSREKEQEYYEQFLQRQPGYFDDTEWYKLVEQADQRPTLEFVECAECGAQNLQEAELCQVCSHVLRGHDCVNPECDGKVPTSAETCPLCGHAQRINESEPWFCAICRRRNAATDIACSGCSAPRDQIDPLSESAMEADSVLDAALSRTGFSIKMPDGSTSLPIDFEVHIMNRPLQPFGQGERCPAVRIAELSKLRVFVDPTHALFRVYKEPTEVLIATELAAQILSIGPRPTGTGMEHLYSNNAVADRILRNLVGVPDSADDAFRQDAEDLLAEIKERLISAFGGAAREVYDSMDETEKRGLAEMLIERGIDIRRLSELIESGAILEYVGTPTIQRVINESPARVFDGKVWRAPYSSLAQLSEQIATQEQLFMRRRYSTFLGDIADQLRRTDPDSAVKERASASLRFLRSQLT